MDSVALYTLALLPSILLSFTLASVVKRTILKFFSQKWLTSPVRSTRYPEFKDLQDGLIIHIMGSYSNHTAVTAHSIYMGYTMNRQDLY